MTIPNVITIHEIDSAEATRRYAYYLPADLPMDDTSCDLCGKGVGPVLTGDDDHSAWVTFWEVATTDDGEPARPARFCEDDWEFLVTVAPAIVAWSQK